MAHKNKCNYHLFFVCDAKMKLHIYFIVKKQQLFKSKLVSVGHSLSTLININT